MRTGIIIGLSLLCAGLLALVASACEGVGNAESRRDKPDLSTAVQVSTVVTETLQEKREMTGDATAWEIVPLSFTVGGRIAAIFFEEGEKVKKGQLLAMLDSKDYRLMRDLARAQVKALDPHLKRAEALKDHEAVTQAQLDEIMSKMEVARIQRSQAESQLSYARLKSPVSGVILKRMASRGDMTDASHPAGIVARMKKMKVVLPVAQRDLPLFVEGKEIAVTAPGIDREFVGKVLSVGYAADKKTRTFPVTLEVENEDLLLRAGMVVEATVVLDTKSGIFLPLDIIRRNLADEPTVLVVDPKTSRVEQRVLQLGDVLGERVHVLAGVVDGEKVVVRGMVNAGDPVNVTEAVGEASKAEHRNTPAEELQASKEPK